MCALFDLVFTRLVLYLKLDTNPASGDLYLYGCNLLLILLHASRTAAPLISDPELAAVGEVLGT